MWSQKNVQKKKSLSKAISHDKGINRPTSLLPNGLNIAIANTWNKLCELGKSDL
jgi:hypothetical protein